jgi:hypothetical protein
MGTYSLCVFVQLTVDFCLGACFSSCEDARGCNCVAYTYNAYIKYEENTYKDSKNILKIDCLVIKRCTLPVSLLSTNSGHLAYVASTISLSVGNV